MPEEKDLPLIDLPTFILSLSHSALMHLGEAPSPEDGRIERNLPLAKQNLDLLLLLEEKTRGNLTGDEERLLSQVIFDVRMRYLEVVKK